MSNNTNKKTSFAAAFKNNLRAWKILFKPCKGIFVSIFLSAFTAAASPLVTIWFSAQLLNELASSRNPAALRNWVLLTLGATAGIMLLNAILQHWREAEESTFSAKMQSVFGKKDLIWIFRMLTVSAFTSFNRRYGKARTSPDTALGNRLKSFAPAAMHCFRSSAASDFPSVCSLQRFLRHPDSAF